MYQGRVEAFTQVPTTEKDDLQVVLTEVNDARKNGRLSPKADKADDTGTLDCSVPISAPQKSSAASTEAEAAKGTSAKPAERWVLPIGANSDDKKKGVPLELIDKPESLPKPWDPPPSTKMDGKCGITGVSNMLRLYGVEKAPADIDLAEYRSWGPGLRSDKFASDLNKLSDKKFSSHSIENGSDPLKVLSDNIKDGKPVAIMYMTSPTNAHWVVVTDVKEGKDGAELTVQSWGNYYKVPFKDIKDQWERGYGGPYPYVVGDEASSKLPKK